MTARPLPFSRPFTGRDPDEVHRSATPLELFFDLCFVVAIAAAAAGLHHALAEGHLADGLLSFLMAFFGIWWAWVNYTWFASAFDSQDVVFRLTTFVIMTGILVLAAGIPSAAGYDHNFTILVVGYVIMRLALVPLWLKVARDHPERRTVALRYAGGIALVQVLWVLRTWLFGHGTFGWVLFALLVVMELAIPYVAEHAGPHTPWHRHHIAERYELMTIIVLGELILSTTQSISASLDANGVSGELLLLVAGSLLLVFSMWWAYFKRPMVETLDPERPFVFGYVHYFVFASVAATGASLSAVNDVIHNEAHVEGRLVLVVLALCVALYLISLSGLHVRADRSPRDLWPALIVAVLVVGVASSGLEPGLSVLLLGVVVAVATSLLQRRANLALKQGVERDRHEEQ